LLQHTAGVFEAEEDETLLARYLANPHQPMEVREIIDHIATHYDADFAPGEGWDYSNTGYLLLGLVIEAADKPYVEAVRSRILEPVGMTQTYLSDLEPAVVDVVHGYAWFDEAWVDVTGWNRGWADSAGGIVSTPSDLALFIRALFNGDLFKERGTLAEMMDIQASGEARYGLGIRRMTSPGDPVGWGHGGATLGYQTMLIYIPADDTVLVLMTNNGRQIPNLDHLLRPALEYWGVRPPD
jgi:D-alanyl-D-alanine carboxypeptidase